MSYIAQLQEQRQRPSGLGALAIGVGALAGGLDQARVAGEDRQRKLEDHLREVAEGRVKAFQVAGQSMVDSGNTAGARALLPDFTQNFNQAYGTNLTAPTIHGTPVMKQGAEQVPTEQLGPPQMGKLMPKVPVETPTPYTYEAGRTFDSPEQQAMVRGGLLLPREKPETFSLGYGEQRYTQVPGQAPKLVATGGAKPITDKDPRYDVDPVTGEVKAVVPGVRFGVKPEKGDKDTSAKEYQRAFSDWQKDGARYVNDYVSLMARNSQRTRVQNGVTMTVPPSPEQMKAWRAEGEALYKASVDQPMPPGGSGKPDPFANPKTPSAQSGGTARWAKQITAASKATGVPEAIIRAVMRQESGGNPNARSPVGATGLMQFMPGTAAGMGINPADPDQAVLAGAKYLKANYEKFGSWKKAIAAYNAGPGAVQKYGGIPPYKETRGYVQRITDDLKAQGIEISAADAAKAASIYEKYGITPGAANA